MADNAAHASIQPGPNAPSLHPAFGLDTLRSLPDDSLSVLLAIGNIPRTEKYIPSSHTTISTVYTYPPAYPLPSTGPVDPFSLNHGPVTIFPGAPTLIPLPSSSNLFSSKSTNTITPHFSSTHFPASAPTANSPTGSTSSISAPALVYRDVASPHASEPAVTPGSAPTQSIEGPTPPTSTSQDAYAFPTSSSGRVRLGTPAKVSDSAHVSDTAGISMLSPPNQIVGGTVSSGVSHKRLPVILGSVLGGLVFLVLVFLTFVLRKRLHHRQQSTVPPADPQTTSRNNSVSLPPLARPSKNRTVRDRVRQATKRCAPWTRRPNRDSLGPGWENVPPTPTSPTAAGASFWPEATEDDSPTPRRASSFGESRGVSPAVTDHTYDSRLTVSTTGTLQFARPVASTRGVSGTSITSTGHYNPDEAVSHEQEGQSFLDSVGWNRTRTPGRGHSLMELVHPATRDEPVSRAV